jgi:hypothetical protein
MTEEPLIYTSIGNVPISTLERKEFWQDNISFELKDNKINKKGTIAYIEEYHDKATGEVVKRSVAVYTFDGLELGAALGNLA